MMFNLGDRVRCIKSNNPTIIGQIGTVIDIDDFGDIGVEYDNPISNGHSCAGSGADGHCWRSIAGNLELVSKRSFKPLSAFI